LSGGVNPLPQKDNDITGRIFGNLKVISDTWANDDSGRVTSLVRCHDCIHQVTKEVRRSALIRGAVKSCGACRNK
jgi:hypothetical protein